MDYNKIVENAKNECLSTNKKHKIVERVKKVTSAVALSLLIIASSISMTACRNYDRRMAYFVSNEDRYAVEEILDKYGLNDSKKHDIEEYRQITEISEENLKGFYIRLGRFESEKIVQILGYEDWDDYLVKHGYVNAFGKGSFDEWEKTWLDEYNEAMEGENTNDESQSNTIRR